MHAYTPGQHVEALFDVSGEFYHGLENHVSVDNRT
jgi:hypothetical protein